MEEIKNNKVLYLQKMHNLEGEVLKADWEEDKSYEMKSGGRTVIVRYVSISKIRKTMAPLLYNSNLDWDISFAEPTLIGDFIVSKAIITFTDVETGYSETYSSCGSGKGEKAVQVSQSFAVKQYLTNKFWIIDGIDAERDDVESPVRTGKEFVPKKMDEVNEIKSKIQDKAMKDEKPVEQEAVKDAVKQETQETEKPKEEIPVNMDVLESKTGVTDEIGYIMTTVEVRTVNNIVAKWNEKLQKGEITPERFKEMDDARLDANSHEAVLGFIRKYKVI